MRIIIGTPIYRDGAYVIEKFLDNQQQIQQNFPDCFLVLSTDDVSFKNELDVLLDRWNLRGTVITHRVERPGYANSRLWNITSGREAIRRYVLSKPEVNRLLFLDADMVYDSRVIDIMERELVNRDAVFSGYRFKNNRIGLIGAGCLLLRREALEKIQFRCFEFKNGQVIMEDNLVEMDLFSSGCRIKKGIFLWIDHYASATDAKHIDPQKVSLYRKMINSSFNRFCFIKISVILHYNIPAKGQSILWRLADISEKSRAGRS